MLTRMTAVTRSRKCLARAGVGRLSSRKSSAFAGRNGLLHQRLPLGCNAGHRRCLPLLSGIERPLVQQTGGHLQLQAGQEKAMYERLSPDDEHGQHLCTPTKLSLEQWCELRQRFKIGHEVGPAESLGKAQIKSIWCVEDTRTPLNRWTKSSHAREICKLPRFDIVLSHYHGSPRLRPTEE